MGKNILVFMDGTRNKPSDQRILKDTNVWKLYDAATPGRGGQTIAKYVRGIGTDKDEAVESPADDLRLFRMREWFPPGRPARRIARLVPRIPRQLALKYGASAVGWGMGDRIREAYGFVCRHYEPGDQVYLFGFSRGAFEARSLAGFIHAVGLLLRSQALGPDAHRLVDMAYEIYRRDDEESFEFLRKFLRRMTRIAAPGPATEFRRATEVRLHFVGVWDTVEALGVGELNKQIPFVRRHTTHHAATWLPANVRNGRHALAIHELRAKFEPLRWEAPSNTQKIKQVWFAGAHADVGGGYRETHLSDIALNWMASEAADAGAATSSPVAFDGFPKPLDAAAVLLPHHAIQGDFFWATPAPRRDVVGFATAAPAVAATISVHPSALKRLFESASTTYVTYPYERDLAWTKYLPGSDTYPGSVAGALSFVDDHVVRMHLSRGGSGSKIRLVTELRLLDEYLAGLVFTLSRSPLDANKLFDALSVLGAFGYTQGVDRFVKAVVRRAGRLTRLADRSVGDGLAIRDKWLPRFIEIGDVLARWQGAAGPEMAALAEDARAQVWQATQALWDKLPYRGPMKAVIDKEKVRRRQQDLQR
jgi:uncharacterized protein (DUF2235 family)